MGRRLKLARSAGFTLAELMVALAIFTMVVGVVLLSQLAGMRLMYKTQTGLETRTSTQRAFSLLSLDVRSARSIRLGHWTNNAFVALGSGAVLEGSALRLFPTGNTNTFVQYYVDTAARRLMRTTNGGSASVVLQGLTNGSAFRGEDSSGALLSNRIGNFALGVVFKFDLQDNPVGAFETRIARRAIE
jgi:prepilin-type N-terminal cleavage/methylation domain-containing protein